MKERSVPSDGLRQPRPRPRVLALAALLCGCRGEAESVADRFVSYYFVEISQDKALPLASGVAREKLREELRLVASVRRGGYTPSQARGSVSVSRGRSRVEGDHVRVEYDLIIGAGEAESRRHVLVVVRREGASPRPRGRAGGWRVSNFQVTDLTPGARQPSR
ncbi:MAG: hypothetical protein AABZ30_08345 [Myxococcota bacterium]